MPRCSPQLRASDLGVLGVCAASLDRELLRFPQCFTRELDGIRSLAVDLPEHHSTVGKHSVPEWFTIALGAAMSYHDLIGVRSLVNRALIAGRLVGMGQDRSEEHTSELQSLMRISYDVFCLNKKNTM